MNKKQTSTTQNKRLMVTTVVAVLAIIIGGLAGYRLAYQEYNPNKTPSQNKPGYVTADAARDQVNNFYQQYLNPRKDKIEESRNAFVSGYGDKNLVFYKDYYQHGFDPIVCSSVMPTTVAVKSVEAGPGAVVNAEAKYPDGSTTNIVLTAVLNTEGFRIDSITCPGTKGNLPPQS